MVSAKKGLNPIDIFHKWNIRRIVYAKAWYLGPDQQQEKAYLVIPANTLPPVDYSPKL